MLTHMQVTSDRLAELTKASPVDVEHVNWTRIVGKYLTSKNLLTVLKKVNFTALMPAMQTLMEKLQPVLDRYIMHLVKKLNFGALLAGHTPLSKTGTEGQEEGGPTSSGNMNEENEDNDRQFEDPGVSRNLPRGPSRHRKPTLNNHDEDEAAGDDEETTSRPGHDNMDEDTETNEGEDEDNAATLEEATDNPIQGLNDEDNSRLGNDEDDRHHHAAQANDDIHEEEQDAEDEMDENEDEEGNDHTREDDEKLTPVECK